MEPKLPTPQFKPEQFPSVTAGTEQDVQRFAAPEFTGENSRAERPQERPPQPPVAQQPVPTLPTIPAPISPGPVAAATPVSSNPVSAADDDLIEREWVDRAKKIITATRDDPYRREVEIAKLQIDYLKKRYGKDLGAAA